MYSLKKTSTALFALTKVKQVSDKTSVKNAIDALIGSLGTDKIVYNQPLDDIVIVMPVDPLDDIIIGVPIDPVYNAIILNETSPVRAAIQELDDISKDTDKEAVKLACDELIDKLNAIIEVVSAL